MSKILPLVIIGVVAYLYVTDISVGLSVDAKDIVLSEAFENRKSNIQISHQGRVVKLLSDDNKGARHQRILVLLKSGQTLLIAHNIDLAPRVENLKVGTTLFFTGEYEWNDKGGVIHWTHRDPRNRHQPGWLKYEGKVYQ